MCRRMLRYWDRITPRHAVFVAFGGSKEDFAALAHPHRALIDWPRLRRGTITRKTELRPRFSGGFAEWLKSQDCRFVNS